MKITWLCPKPEAPSGGVDVIHRNAALLDENGIPSRVVQSDPFVCWWSENQVQEYIYRGTSVSRDEDTVVIPEVMWADNHDKYHDPIMFLQNYIWLGKGDYAGVKVLVCSRHLYNYAKRELKANCIGIVRPYLDETPWRVTAKTANRTLVVARRNTLSPKLRDMLTAEGFPVEYVDQPLTQAQLFEKFSACEFYAHLTTPEGFPAICLEAMRCGTLVVGTAGGGGVEFMFGGENCIVTQDPVYGHISDDEFLGQVVEGLKQLRDNAGLRSAMWQKARNWSLRYNKQATTAELLKVFGNGRS